MIGLDCWTSSLDDTTCLYLLNRVVHERAELFEATQEVRQSWEVDSRWLYLVQFVGQVLIRAAAEDFDLDLSYNRPSRTANEVLTSILVHPNRQSGKLFASAGMNLRPYARCSEIELIGR